MSRSPHTPSFIATPLAFVWNMILAYIAYWLCRLVYWAENAGAFQGFWNHNSLSDIFHGSWMFDTSAILYTNVLYALLMLVPLHWKETRGWQQVAKWLFVVVNGLAICINLTDAAYFPYTGRRTTTTVFQEFSHEGNLGGIFAVELLRHWYLVLAAVALIVMLWKGYKRPYRPYRPTPLPLPEREGSGHQLTAEGEAASQIHSAPLPNRVAREEEVDFMSSSPSDRGFTHKPRTDRQGGGSAGSVGTWTYYIIHFILFVAYIPLTVIGMRGGATTAVRPITISNANQYVERPAEAAIILNTPFSLIRTIGKAVFVTPNYFDSEEELERVFTPVHNIPGRPIQTHPLTPPCEGGELSPLTAEGETASQIHSAPLPHRVAREEEVDFMSSSPSDRGFTHKPRTDRQGGGSAEAPGSSDSPSSPHNVVILIVESFGREYIGALNETLEDGKYQGYTPFVDELCDRSATFQWSFCNGRKSIDGMPSILSGIPMFVEPFFLTPASMNEVGGLAQALGEKGYETAFFHGAENGSMGFQAFARKTGFQKYFGRTEYNADPHFDGDKDYDGMWAIWDKPFLQFYAQQMNELREPFMTAVFTASSHHPYAIPEEYRDTFPEEGIIIHKCIRYTDHALRRFFETAQQQPWFHNTLFVLTSDHTNLSDHAFYQTDIGGFCSPIIFYDPSGELLQPGRREGIAQQTDIMPSVLGLLGYDKSFVAFGCDLFHTPPDCTWAVNYNNGIYQYVKHNLLLQLNSETGKATALYELTDSLLQRNILGQRNEQTQMELELKAIIQQYMSRMNEDRLVPSGGSHQSKQHTSHSEK